MFSTAQGDGQAEAKNQKDGTQNDDVPKKKKKKSTRGDVVGDAEDDPVPKKKKKTKIVGAGDSAAKKAVAESDQEAEETGDQREDGIEDHNMQWGGKQNRKHNRKHKRTLASVVPTHLADQSAAASAAAGLVSGSQGQPPWSASQAFEARNLHKGSPTDQSTDSQTAATAAATANDQGLASCLQPDHMPPSAATRVNGHLADSSHVMALLKQAASGSPQTSQKLLTSYYKTGSPHSDFNDTGAAPAATAATAAGSAGGRTSTNGRVSPVSGGGDSIAAGSGDSHGSDPGSVTDGAEGDCHQAVANADAGTAAVAEAKEQQQGGGEFGGKATAAAGCGEPDANLVLKDSEQAEVTEGIRLNYLLCL